MNTIDNIEESIVPPDRYRDRNGILAAFLIASILVILLGLGMSGCSSATVSASSAAAGRYALVIGIQDYPGDTSDLSYTDDDAESMTTLLAAKGWTVTKTLISSEATYANIKSAIAAFADQSAYTDNSTVLVYYSGHGSYDNSTAYIIPYDGLVASGKYYTYGSTTYEYAASDTSKWITPATLSNWLGALSCANKLVILDSCYSGGFVDEGTSSDASPSDTTGRTGTTETGMLAEGLSNLSTLLAASASGEGDPDVMTISAAGSEEYSYDDSTTQHGIFTYYLLNSAASGDSDGDGYVSTSEAFAYVKTKLKAWDSANMSSWSTYGESLLPHISGGTGDFVLFDNN